jgi:2-polyprenyl-3-methyl-5-hydroxy-6-metoxy-1,4-benzoquinol methylase
MQFKDIYADGTYRANNPDWHSADSAWKADRIAAILTRNSVDFTSCIEVGCGAGQVLARLSQQMPGKHFSGYDVSPDPAKFWAARPDAGLTYHLQDFTEADECSDLLLLIDVFEHIEDYMGFLRKLARRARWFVFHIPLDMHMSGLLRDRQLHARRQVGHLHYFSRATALATLADTGYVVIEDEFTNLSHETTEGRRALTIFANVARTGLHAISPNLAAKVLGGYSLLALCRADGPQFG